MNLLVSGILMGLALSFLVGPILFALIQVGIEQGFRAGVVLGLGIWISDFVYIGSVYWGISYVAAVTEMEGFEFYLGGIGGIILIAIGLGTFFSPPPALESGTKVTNSSYLALWMKGFLINTLNPFTLLFWLSMMSTVVLKEELSDLQAGLFFGGIMGTVVIFDSLKVYLAKLIRNKLKPLHILRMRQVSGAALFIFGVALIVRVAIDTA